MVYVSHSLDHSMHGNRAVSALFAMFVLGACSSPTPGRSATKSHRFTEPVAECVGNAVGLAQGRPSAVRADWSLVCGQRPDHLLWE